MVVEADTAARWWAQQFADGTDPMRSADIPPPTSQQVATFLDTLRDGLLAAMTGPPTTHTLGVDYDPDPLLADALRAAGATPPFTIQLPIKTLMWIEPGHIRVRRGETGPIHEIPLHE
ncbi:hypothetical protein [Nocardia wallacei]|uniref:hypothetical protein n=1 Tax=Nocardia wallacei TaxID=480035 RepID=UPI00245894B4|nr:hypothetical protein [Nocardia wallacei]